MKTDAELRKMAEEYVHTPRYDENGHKGSFISGYRAKEAEQPQPGDEDELWDAMFDKFRRGGMYSIKKQFTIKRK